MKLYEQKVIPQREATVCVGRKCDLCGRRSQDRGNSWSDENYVVGETEVSYSEGSSYPEGGWGIKYEIDICPKCFVGKLIPWLREQGAVVKEEVWGW